MRLFVEIICMVVLAMLGIGITYYQGFSDGVMQEIKRSEKQHDNLWKVISKKQYEIDGLWEKLERLRIGEFDPNNAT